ncbi:hypothetical protein EDB81DRAFT_641284 [Dactylonectria macrodidyma]|uniref:Uncharacterized protein n=1 Tax=Dactylonectria macrodidyma TaxID=307937 RepID=A0A9P9FPS1_9HYPO|nr:hypothetical protein EDB81DRAFT_641284 [Dactylonectria macrodidyma]
MTHNFVPFASGPVREKKVLSLGFYRTGSHSLQEALSILGYRAVFHSSAMARCPEKWIGLGAAADDNIPCLPSYTGRTWARADWDAYFGPCEALTDVTPFAEPLLAAYPDAKVILVGRDFDHWAESFLDALVGPSSDSFAAWISGNWMEPVLGLHITQNAWKMYMGLLGVCDLRKATDRRIMRAAYDRHYTTVRRIVAPERLLELDLKDLGWEPLCTFLGKDVPSVPFPRLNEGRVFRNEYRRLHFLAILGGTLKLVSSIAIGGGVLVAALSLTRGRGFLL